MTEVDIDVVTFACQEHKHQVFDTLRWHLVHKGIWYINALSLDFYTDIDKKCFCGKTASHIIKYKIPLKGKA